VSETKCSESNLNVLLCGLGTELDAIFNHDAMFLDEFAKGDYMLLAEVSFTNNSLKITYVLNCGRHVCDTIPIDEYMEWRRKYLNT